MANNLEGQSAADPAVDSISTQGRVLSTNVYDRCDSDAINVNKSWRVSLASTELLQDKSGSEVLGKSAEQNYDASVVPGESQSLPQYRTEPPTGTNSPGYARIQTLRDHILPSEKTLLFAGILLLATAHSIDNFLRVLYQIEVTTYFHNSGILGAINTISTLSAATITPMISKSADVFGRPETLLVSVLSYVLGTALQANSASLRLFCVGAVFWTIGFLGVISMFEILIADITSMRLRVIAFYLPAVPYLITTWISAPLQNALCKTWPDWPGRFVGSAIVYTVCSVPLIVSMFAIERRTEKRALFSNPDCAANREGRTLRNLIDRRIFRFRQMDIPGWICFALIVMCLFSPWAANPIVISDSRRLWFSPAMIAVVVTGILCIPIIYYIEKYAKYPLFSTKILQEPRVLTALSMGFLYHLAYYAQHTYLYIGLIVRHGESADAAVRIVGLYTFTSTLVGLCMGIIISITRDLRWYLRFGAIFYLASFVLQYTRPSGADNIGHITVTCSQILLGIAGGLFPFPAMAFIQGARDHTQLSTLIGAYLTACRVGGGVGQSLAGAIWTNALKPRLHEVLDSEISKPGVDLAYNIPTMISDMYAWDTPVRMVFVKVYAQSHRYLCAVGIIASALLIILAFMIRDASLEGPPENGRAEPLPRSGDETELRESSKKGLTLPSSRLPIFM